MKLIFLIFVSYVANIQAYDFSNIFGPGFPFNYANNNNLGAQIQAEVQTSVGKTMQQVNALVADISRKNDATSAVLAMVHGLGGSAKISYNGQTVLVNDYHITKCNGDIITNTDGFVCNGESVPLDDNVCVPGANSYGQVNDVFCINNGYNSNGFSIINGQINCPNGRIYTKDNLDEKCGSNVLAENYAQVSYIPNVNNPQHISIPSNNQYIPCKNIASNICEFDTNLSGFKNVW